MNDNKKLYRATKKLAEDFEHFCDGQEDCVECPFNIFTDRCPPFVLMDYTEIFKKWRDENE